MKKPSEVIMLGTSVFTVMVLIIFFAFSLFYEHMLSASREKLATPDSLKIYRKLADSGAASKSLTEMKQSDATDEISKGVVNSTIEDFALLFSRRDEHFKDEELGVLFNKILADCLRKDPETWTDEQWQDIRDFVEQSQDLILKIRQVSERGGPIYLIDVSKGLYADLPYLSRMRGFSRILWADAIVKSVDGNYGDAVEDVIAGMRLGNALAGEPYVVSQRVRMRISEIMMQTVRDAFKPCELSSEQIDKLIVCANKSINREAIADSLLCKAQMTEDMFESFRKGDSSLYGGLGDHSPSIDSFTQRLAYKLYISPIGKPWLDRDENKYLSSIQEISQMATQPYFKISERLNDVEIQISNLSLATPVSRLKLGGTGNILRRQAQYEAGLGMMKTGLLVEQYYIDNGTYPDRLDDIKTDMVTSIDPFSGDQFAYRTSEDGFLLYSVGRNCKDDGGIHWPGSYDIVWRGRMPEGH